MQKTLDFILERESETIPAKVLTNFPPKPTSGDAKTLDDTNSAQIVDKLEQLQKAIQFQEFEMFQSQSDILESSATRVGFSRDDRNHPYQRPYTGSHSQSEKSDSRIQSAHSSLPASPPQRRARRLSSSDAVVHQPLPAMSQYQCTHESCRDKVWHRGFATEADLQKHLGYHRCYWAVIRNGGLVENCDFVPANENALRRHVEEHLQHDHIPSMPNHQGKPMWFCPWQTCSSVPYSLKGTTNRCHIADHVRKHISKG